MKGWLPLALGLMGVVLGILWTLQGLGQITDSLLSDSTVWTVIGPVVVLAGVGSIVFGLRARNDRPAGPEQTGSGPAQAG